MALLESQVVELRIAARVAVNLWAKIEVNTVELMVRPINAPKRRKITSVPAARPVSSTCLTLAVMEYL